MGLVVLDPTKSRPTADPKHDSATFHGGRALRGVDVAPRLVQRAQSGLFQRHEKVEAGRDQHARAPSGSGVGIAAARLGCRQANKSPPREPWSRALSPRSWLSRVPRPRALPSKAPPPRAPLPRKACIRGSLRRASGRGLGLHDGAASEQDELARRVSPQSCLSQKMYASHGCMNLCVHLQCIDGFMHFLS